MVSPFGFSFASLRCGAMLPSLADFERVHRLLRRLGSRRRITDVLPPQLRELRIVRHVVAGRGPLHARGRAVELDQAAKLRRALGERLVPDVGFTDEGETDAVASEISVA